MRDFNLHAMNSAHLNTAPAKVKDLMKKLFQRTSPFMIHEGIRNQCTGKAHLPHSDTELNIFRVTIEPKATCLFKHFSTDAHVKTSGLKFSCNFFAPANS